MPFKGKKIIFKNREYPSRTALAKHLGITRQALQNRIAKGNMNIKQASDIYTCVHCNRDIRKHPTYISLEYGYANFLQRIQYCAYCYTTEDGINVKRKE